VAQKHAATTNKTSGARTLLALRRQGEGGSLVRASLTWLDITVEERRVFVVATTNYPHIMDESITRRFRKIILFDLPDVATRAAIIGHHLKTQQHKLTEEQRSLLAWASTSATGDDVRKWRCVVARSGPNLVRSPVVQAGNLSREHLDPVVVHTASWSLDARALLAARRQQAARSAPRLLCLDDCVRALYTAGVTDVVRFQTSLQLYRQRRMLPTAS